MAPTLAEAQPGQVAEIKGQEEWDEAMKRAVVSVILPDVTAAPVCSQLRLSLTVRSDHMSCLACSCAGSMAQGSPVLRQKLDSRTYLGAPRVACIRASTAPNPGCEPACRR